MPRTLARICLLLLLPLLSQAEDSPRDLWPQSTAAVDSGDMKGAATRLGQLLEQSRTLGIRRHLVFSESAAGLAYQADVQKNAELAKWASDAARQLDPRSPQVAFSEADRMMAKGDYAGAAKNLVAGIGRTFSDYATSKLARTDLMVVLLLAITASILGFAIALFLRYCRPAAHDFREALSRRFSAGVTTVLAVALLFLPIFLWLGPFWLVIFWLVLFFPYGSVVERVVIVISLLFLALLPVALYRASYGIAGSDSPVVRAAAASHESAYTPDTVKRMRLLSEALPEEPRVHLLLGNLEAQEGSEAEAMVHYRKAGELDDKFAGAFVNQGNLHFMNGDFQTALTQYQKAAEIEPNLAIAHYNHSVTSGELYRFDEQGAKLAEARKFDRAFVENVSENPPAQKVVTYTLPIGEAWQVAERVAKNPAAREVFGNYVSFDAMAALRTPLTIAALLGLVMLPIFWSRRKKTGVAGACIKCGRTFCSRCKSARESATYCTQCIHIYLKRDGVALDTKKSKLVEVQKYQSETLRERKLVATFFPGGGRMHEGLTLRGILPMVLFFFFVGVAVFIGRMAPVAGVAEFLRLSVRVLATTVAVILWFATAISIYRQRSIG